MVVPFKFREGQVISSHTLLDAWLSMLGLKLINVSKSGHWCWRHVQCNSYIAMLFCRPLLSIILFLTRLIAYRLFNGPGAQIAPIPYPIMHNFVTEKRPYLHILATKWCILGYLSNTLWDLWVSFHAVSYINWQEICCVWCFIFIV